MKILLIGGSAAENSHTTALLTYISKIAKKEFSCDVEVIDLRGLDLPNAKAEYHKKPKEFPDTNVVEFIEKIEESDALILGSPLYHGSYSGLLKNALDHLSWDAFRGKRVGVVSNSGGERKANQANLLLVPVIQTLFGQPTQTQIGTCPSDYDLELEPNQEIKDRCRRLVVEIVND